MTTEKITIRPEEHKDYESIVSLILRSFREGTDYSDGTDIIALVEEIRDSEYYIPELSFVAELNGKIVGHFLFSRFPLSLRQSGTKRHLRRYRSSQSTMGIGISPPPPR